MLSQEQQVTCFERPDETLPITSFFQTHPYKNLWSVVRRAEGFAMWGSVMDRLEWGKRSLRDCMRSGMRWSRY